MAVIAINNMKKFLFYIVKYVKWIYSLYFYVGSFALRVLKLFVRPNDKLILFISFGGRKYDDSPKAIYVSSFIKKFLKKFFRKVIDIDIDNHYH